MIWQNIRIFLFFLYRDWHVLRQKLHEAIINYVIIYPFLYAFGLAFLQTHLLFPSAISGMGTLLYAGNIILIFLVLTYAYNINLLFDLEGNRYINYQITILHPRLVLFERILFSSLYTFCMTIPFFPIGKLILQSQLDLSHTNWIQLLCILLLSSFVTSSYHILVSCTLTRSSQLVSFWMRCNQILIAFSGFWVPRFVMESYSPILGYIALLNPLTYLTEGTRVTLLGGKAYLSFTTCCFALIIFSCIFTFSAWYILKKRLDHI